MKWLSLVTLLVVVMHTKADYVREFSSGPSTNRIRSRQKESVATVERPAENETVPLWILQDLDKVDNPYTFLTQFVEDGVNFTVAPLEVTPLAVSVDGYGDSHEENTGRHSDRTAVEADGGPVFASPAGCKPRPTVIPLYDEYNPRMIVYPKCTILEQCQGCCHLASHNCQPKDKEPVFVRVIKAMYVGDGRKLTYLGKFTVQLEKHNECECSCKVQPSDCNLWQKHNPYTCNCDCKDEEARRGCLQDMESRVWEDTSCTCRCRHERPCSSGLYFDHDECSCKPIMGFEDGFPRVYAAGRHGYYPAEEAQLNVTLTPMYAPAQQHSPSASTTSTTTSSTTTTTTPRETTAQPRRKDEDFFRRLRRLRNRSRHRTTSNSNNL